MREDATFGDFVVRALEKAGVSAASLTFEILTADAAEYAPEIARFMAPLRAAGITFALSWFAGEELALNFAPKMGFSYLKLDPSSHWSSIARRELSKLRKAAVVPNTGRSLTL